MCWLAGVSRASYYRHWLDSTPRRAETGLRDLIQRMALGNAHYGYRRIAALLRREGWQVNHKCILRIMREDNLLCLRARPFVPLTTNSRHGWHVVPNLARGMILNGVNQLWVADITFLHLAEEFAFLAVVLDAFSRKVVGWALDTHLRASLAIEALEMAITTRHPEFGSLVHHSDRPIRLRGLLRTSAPARYPGEHEPCRQSLRQRAGGELLENPEAGRGARSRL
ncbi:IS3 family transposase [Mesorhizobium sp. ArgA1]